MKILFPTVIFVFFSVLTPLAANAQLIDLSKTQLIELGDIGSDGESGRQLHVRELLDSEFGRDWVFFPPHVQLPDSFPDPTPPSPSQESLNLTEEMPLVVVIPQLQHFPTFGSVDVGYDLIGNTLTIDASLHTGSGATATIYGPHEYLVSIGELTAGQYRLELNLTRTNDFSDGVVTMSGFSDFQVHAAPEPSTTMLALVGVAMAVSHRRNRKWCHLTNR